MQEYLSTLLKELGFPVHSRGYQLISEAVFMILQAPNLLHQLTTELYPVLAQRHKTSAKSVEHCIRHSIEAAWLKGNGTLINTLFQYTIDPDKGRPSNGLFLAVISEHLQLKFPNKPAPSSLINRKRETEKGQINQGEKSIDQN